MLLFFCFGLILDGYRNFRYIPMSINRGQESYASCLLLGRTLCQYNNPKPSTSACLIPHLILISYVRRRILLGAFVTPV